MPQEAKSEVDLVLEFLSKVIAERDNVPVDKVTPEYVDNRYRDSLKAAIEKSGEFEQPRPKKLFGFPFNFAL